MPRNLERFPAAAASLYPWDELLNGDPWPAFHELASEAAELADPVLVGSLFSVAYLLDAIDRRN